MNCPGGILVYKTKMRSYKDLPLRIGELGVVHRHELSGALHGLMRVRCFTQDDAHIFMTPEQIKEEIKGVVRLIDKVYSTFGFQYHIELSTMPEDHMGAIEDWNTAVSYTHLFAKGILLSSAEISVLFGTAVQKRKKFSGSWAIKNTILRLWMERMKILTCWPAIR